MNRLLATATRLEPRPLAPGLGCVQPRPSLPMRLELLWGRLRRAYLRGLRPGYVARMRERRTGDCPGCAHDIVDARDLKYLRNACGWRFPADDDPRERQWLPLAAMGRAEVLVTLALTGTLAALAWLLWPPLAAAPAALALFVVAFFRDPPRQVPDDPGAVVAPADGRITDVEEIGWDADLEGPAVKIGIYLSIWSVHLNRAPETARVIEVRYRPGTLRDVRHPLAPAENESLWTLFECEAPPHRRLAVRQIAGKFASRVVGEARPGELLRRGEKYGMIKFGSRTELLLAAEPGLEVRVRPGDRVRGGSSILARYPL